MAWTLCVCRTSIGSSRTPLASWSCWRERATIWILCGSTFPRCMSGHLACFFLYVVHHQSFEILMTPKAQPAAVWTADLYRLRHLPNLHWSAAMIRPLMMTRPDEVYNLNLMDLQLFAFFHFNFLPSFRFPAIDGIPSNDWHGALMHQTFRQALPSQKKQLEFQCSLCWFEGVVPRWFDPHFVSNSLMHSVGRQGLHKWWRRPDLTQGISCDLIQKVVILLVIWVCNGFLNVASIYYVLPNCVWLVARWGVFSGAAGLCKAQGWSLKGYCK